MDTRDFLKNCFLLACLLTVVSGACNVKYGCSEDYAARYNYAVEGCKNTYFESSRAIDRAASAASNTSAEFLRNKKIVVDSFAKDAEFQSCTETNFCIYGDNFPQDAENFVYFQNAIYKFRSNVASGPHYTVTSFDFDRFEIGVKLDLIGDFELNGGSYFRRVAETDIICVYQSGDWKMRFLGAQEIWTKFIVTV